MSFRIWLYFIAIGISVATLLCFSWVSFSTYQQDKADERDYSAQYYADTSKESVDDCGVIMDEGGVFDWLACLADNINADVGKKQAEYDLKAQQDMAEWAYGMLIVTIWIAGITFVGVGFVAWTLFATRTMAEDTRNMARETRRIGEAQIRAYISISAMDLFGVEPNGKLVSCVVTVKQMGSSPANDLQCWVAVNDTNGRRRSKKESFSALPHNGFHNFGITLPEGEINWRDPVYFIAFVRYRDVFHKRHFTKVIFEAKRDVRGGKFEATAIGGYRT